MVPWDVPAVLEVGAIPRKVYVNRELQPVLERALRIIVERDLAGLIKTWDGCYQVRRMRGASSMSLHSWGIAVDINAAWNQLGKPPTLDPRIVAAFEEAGAEWGGRWHRPDGMHFQLARFP